MELVVKRKRDAKTKQPSQNQNELRAETKWKTQTVHRCAMRELDTHKLA